MFRHEWRLSGAAGSTRPLASIAIVDVAPEEQYLYPEFLLFQQLFERHGLRAVIADPAALEWRDGVLWHGDLAIDLVYNRLTDFYLEQTGSAALREAYLQQGVVLTPHQQAHALYADKRHLALFSDAAQLQALRVPPATQQILLEHVPHTEVVDAADAQRLFAHLDDHRRLASHMEKPSLMMAGATLRVETDELKGQAVGSVTRGEPRLLGIGACRMGFTIAAQGDRSRLLVFIDYQLPARGSRVGLRCCSVGPMRPGAPGAWPPMRWLRSLACRTDEAAAFQRFAPHSAAWGNPCFPAQCRFDRIGPNLRARLAFEHRLDLFERADQRPPARRLRETGGRFDLGAHRTFGELVARQLARRQLAQGSLPRPPPVEIDPRATPGGS